MTLHRRAMDTQRQALFHRFEQPLLIVAASGRIADDADRMAGGDLRLGQVAHMPEDSPDR